jgi:hypothetical protein
MGVFYAIITGTSDIAVIYHVSVNVTHAGFGALP